MCRRRRGVVDFFINLVWVRSGVADQTSPSPDRYRYGLFRLRYIPNRIMFLLSILLIFCYSSNYLYKKTVRCNYLGVFIIRHMDGELVQKYPKYCCV